MPDDDPHAATRSDSATVEPAKPRRRDKGKRKESDNSSLRVKEEPKASSLLSPEPSSNLVCLRFYCAVQHSSDMPPQLSNEDHCSACRSFGSLVYCDGCPRAFHFWCLDPPLESVDEGNAQWFCPACVARKVRIRQNFRTGRLTSRTASSAQTSVVFVIVSHPSDPDVEPRRIPTTRRYQVFLQGWCVCPQR